MSSSERGRRFIASGSLAGRAVAIPVERTRRVSGRYMSAAQLPYLVREFVVVDGAVSSERARRLYNEATAVFQAALERVPPLPPGARS
jgi:hypothetical protein